MKSFDLFPASARGASQADRERDRGRRVLSERFDGPRRSGAPPAIRRALHALPGATMDEGAEVGGDATSAAWIKQGAAARIQRRLIPGRPLLEGV